MTWQELNAYDRVEFVAALGWIFEGSPWVAERAWDRRPFSGVDQLHATMTRVVTEAATAEQLALLRAHPDLGVRAKMSAASAGEQQGAGLDRLTPDEFDRLQRLNAEYKETFGFPFLFAVKGSTKHDVLAALERRSQAAPEQEFDEAMRQVGQIARFRLEELIRPVS